MYNYMPFGGFASSGCLRHERDILSMTTASIFSTCWGIPFPHADLPPIFVIWKAFGGRTGLWSRDGLEHRGQSQHRGGAALPRRGGLGAAPAQRGGRSRDHSRQRGTGLGSGRRAYQETRQGEAFGISKGEFWMETSGSF